MSMQFCVAQMGGRCFTDVVWEVSDLERVMDVATGHWMTPFRHRC